MWEHILPCLIKQALHRPKMGTDAEANPRASGQSLTLMKISKRNGLSLKEINLWKFHGQSEENVRVKQKWKSLESVKFCISRCC